MCRGRGSRNLQRYTLKTIQLLKIKEWKIYQLFYLENIKKDREKKTMSNLLSDTELDKIILYQNGP